MARVNQGIYKQYKNKKDSIINEIRNELNDMWDDDGCLSPSVDIECIEIFFDQANSLFINATDLSEKYSTIIETQKFEDEKSTQNYESFIQEIDSARYELQDKFKSLLKLLKTQLSDEDYKLYSSYQIYTS